MNWAQRRSVSRTRVLLFQWTVYGDNGAGGHLARSHVDWELRFQEGGFEITSKRVEEAARETHSKIGNATYIFAQV